MRLAIGDVQIQSNLYGSVSEGEVGERLGRDCYKDERNEQDRNSSNSDADCNKEESTTKQNVSPGGGQWTRIVGHCWM
jgi:hypothetical protein